MRWSIGCSLLDILWLLEQYLLKCGESIKYFIILNQIKEYVGALQINNIKYLDLISCNTVTLLQILTDWKLIIIVLVIVSVAVFLLLLGEVIPFLRRTVALMDDPEHGDGRNVRSCTP